ncbi:MAG: YraN family protein [Bacteroidales bacterium]|nr:YraN family protein [Bacteroidales bacterium]
MAKTQEIGKQGEDIARQYLLDHDYEIVETNWRMGHLEADIIAYKDHRLVFVEVKTRKNVTYGSPEEFVDHKKQKAYIKLANAYVLKYNRMEEVQFDIIGILYNNEGHELIHLPAAYTTLG